MSCNARGHIEQQSHFGSPFRILGRSEGERLAVAGVKEGRTASFPVSEVIMP